LKYFILLIQSITMVCVDSFQRWIADHDCALSWGSCSTESHSFPHCEQGPWLDSIFCNALRITGLPREILQFCSERRYVHYRKRIISEKAQEKGSPQL